MAETTDKPALTVNQQAALTTFIVDYAVACAAVAVAEATGEDADTVRDLRDRRSEAYRGVLTWIDAVRFVKDALDPRDDRVCGR